MFSFLPRQVKTVLSYTLFFGFLYTSLFVYFYTFIFFHISGLFSLYLLILD